VTCAEITPERIRVSIRRHPGGNCLRRSWRSCSSPSIVLDKRPAARRHGNRLVVTKRLVELMGGVMGVESAVGDGKRVLDRR